MALRQLTRLHDAFWGEVDTRIYAGLRIIFSMLALLQYWTFRPILESQFSDGSWFTRATAVATNQSLGWSPLFFFGSPSFVLGWFAATMLCLGTLLVGYRTRLSAVAVCVGLFALRDRNPFPWDPRDEFIRIVLTLLAFAPSGGAWSLDARTAPRSRGPGGVLQLLRAQLVLVYLTAGVSKLSGPSWWNGTALSLAAANPAISRFELGVGPWAQLLTWITPEFEILVAIALCVPIARRIAVVLALAFHLGTAIIFKVELFPVIMGAWCLTFVPEIFVPDLQRYRRMDYDLGDAKSR